MKSMKVVLSRLSAFCESKWIFDVDEIAIMLR